MFRLASLYVLYIQHVCARTHTRSAPSNKELLPLFLWGSSPWAVCFKLRSISIICDELCGALM